MQLRHARLEVDQLAEELGAVRAQLASTQVGMHDLCNWKSVQLHSP
jgi:hypothetical protein